MRVNGYINLQIETGGGEDPVTGFPIPVTTSWSRPIECSYLANTSPNKGSYADGQFTIASYIVDIETQDLPEFDTIRLTDDRGNILGTANDPEKRVFPLRKEPEYLDLVDRIRITI